MLPELVDKVDIVGKKGHGNFHEKNRAFVNWVLPELGWCTRVREVENFFTYTCNKLCVYVEQRA